MKRYKSIPGTSTLAVKKRSKHRNVKTLVDGIDFASKKEAARYGELKLLERVGEITDLKVQPSYELKVNDELICKYIADFSYYNAAGIPRIVVEDVKGMKKGCAWSVFRIKAKLMAALHDIDVVVI